MNIGMNIFLFSKLSGLNRRSHVFAKFDFNDFCRNSAIRTDTILAMSASVKIDVNKFSEKYQLDGVFKINCRIEI